MYTFPELLEGELNAIINYEKPKWADHPILKAKYVIEFQLFNTSKI